MIGREPRDLTAPGADRPPDDNGRAAGIVAAMTLAARLTAPLARLDRPVNAVNDIGVRSAPWLWWPARAPRRTEEHRPVHHVIVVAWALGVQLLDERLQPAAQPPRGARRQVRRAVSVGLTVAASEALIGAWDRRAATLRRRRWWRPLG